VVLLGVICDILVGLYFVGNGRLASHQLRDNDLSRSMPVPSAPFLASRRDRATGERLSR